MQAVILAGGRGTRLRPLTNTMPKAMVPVRGEPFISHLLKLLRRGGVHEVILCVSYLAGHVGEFVSDGKKWGIQVYYSLELPPLGTAGALKQADRQLDDTFLVVNGDTYLPIDYSDVMAKFASSGKKGMIVAYGNKPHSGVRNDLLVEGDKVIRCSKSSPESEFNHVNAGVVALAKETAQLLPKEGDLEGFYNELIKMDSLTVYTTRQIFYDIGTFEGIKRLEEYLLL